MKKQVQLIIPALFMISANLTGYGQQSVGEKFIDGDFQYEITSLSPGNNQVRVHLYKGTATEVTIPPMVEDQYDVEYKVTAIGEDNDNDDSTQPFAGKELTSVEIPETVTIIGLGAFNGKQLAEVTIPNSVTTIRRWAFSRSAFTEVTIPANVVSIGYQAFYENTNLKLVTVEAMSPPTLHATAFQRSPLNQIDVVVPGDVIDEYKKPANGWTVFKSIVLGTFTDNGTRYVVSSSSPPEVEIIEYVGNGTAVTIPSTVKDQDDIEYKVTAINNEAFSSKGLTSVNFADQSNVTRIGDFAFAFNTLTELTIPSSVTSIGVKAFWIEQNVKEEGNGLTRLTFADQGKVTSIGKWAFMNNQLTEVTIPGSVINIRLSAFEANELTEVNFSTPGKLTRIDTAVFKANKLTSVTIPNGVESIENSAFSYNKELTQVTIPEGVKSIGPHAFASMPIGGTVRVEATTPPSVAANAFFNRSRISLDVPKDKRQVYLDNGWTGFRSMGYGNFTHNGIRYGIASPTEVEIIDYVGNAKGVTIPPKVSYKGTDYEVTAIGNDAFRRKGLTSVNFADQSNVTRIGEWAFARNTLTEVTIPNSVTAIGHRAFWQEPHEQEDGLTSVTFADQGDLRVIGEMAFMYNKLSKVTIPSSVTRIENDAFQANELTEVTFSTSSQLTRINEGAFKVNQLTSVTIPEGVDSIGNSAFSANSQLTQVTLPGSVKWIDIWAFNSMPIGGTVRLEGTTPPSIEGNTFHRSRIDVDVPRDKRQVYLANGWTGFRSMGIFTDKDIKYGITDVTTNEVMVIDYTGSAAGVDIPRTVDDNNETYTVTSIGQHAFRDNHSTSVTIPGGVTRIDSVAFMDNPNLALVTVKADEPPALHADAFQDPGRDQIDVIVPRGTRAGNIKTAYEAEWTGFASITGGIRVSIDAPALVDNLMPFLVTITFTRNVTRFTQEDIADNLVGAILVDGSFSQVDGSTYTLEVTPTSCAGTITIEVPGNVAEYAPSFPNLAASATITVNASAPAVSTPVEYCVGETATALTATGDNLLWYTTPTGGTGEAAAPIPRTATAGETSYFVSQTTDGCESDRAEIVVTVVEACPAQIGDVFTISYEITSVNPNEVKVVDYTGSATAVEIPETVTYEGITYTVTAISANAFSDNPGLSTVKIEATPPPSIHDDAFADRGRVDLVVPTGMRQAYIDEGWTGFASITEEQVVTAIHNYEFNDFTLYPNPARDKVYIDIDPRPGQELKQVNIYTMTGTHLYSENGPVINTSRLPRGTYLFEIVTQTGDRSMRRVIIQ